MGSVWFLAVLCCLQDLDLWSWCWDETPLQVLTGLLPDALIGMASSWSLGRSLDWPYCLSVAESGLQLRHRVISGFTAENEIFTPVFIQGNGIVLSPGGSLGEQACSETSVERTRGNLEAVSRSTMELKSTLISAFRGIAGCALFGSLDRHNCSQYIAGRVWDWDSGSTVEQSLANLSQWLRWASPLERPSWVELLPVLHTALNTKQLVTIDGTVEV